MKYQFITKEKLGFVGLNIVLLTIISIILNQFDIANLYITSLWFINFLPLMSYILMDYRKKKSFYNNLIDQASRLEEKYHIASIIKKPSFQEGEILYETLYDASKSMLEHVNLHKLSQVEYREYIEQWVHEIKTPLAAIHLLLENNGRKIDVLEEIVYVNNYIQQVLYYARSQDPQKDFFVKQFDIHESMRVVLKKYARRFITSNIQLNYQRSSSLVFADSKWTQYIIEQIISNALKYTRDEECKITITGIENEHNYTLIIEDNGVGIPSHDLSRIYDKGFTGTNGRKYGNSTGMGLYICKSLCDKLYIGLDIESEVGTGTKAFLSFPISSVYYK